MKSRLFGILLFIETAALLATAGVAAYYHVHGGEQDLDSFLITAGITGFNALVLTLIGRRRKNALKIEDTFVIVTLSWVLFSVFGMLPFLLSGVVDNVTDAFFETMSGFTTTGSTILRDVDGQSHAILFWRSVMQWLGGLGIVVFTLAFVPSVAKGSRNITLFAAEAPGLSVEKLAPTMQGTSSILWAIYIFLTVACAVFYWLGPMDFFDAVCHAMTTTSTGGFSTHADSIGYFQSSYLEYVCAVFMLLSGISFAIYHFTLIGRFDVIRKNEEFKVYLISILVMTAFFVLLFYITPHFHGVTESQLADYPDRGEPIIRTSFFHVSSMLSNTGFAAGDSNYDRWGMLFVIPTMMMMIIGGCAGSTSGGIKIIRVIVIFKVIKNALKELIHPTGMFSVKVSGQTVDETSVRRVINFLSLFVVLFIVNAVVLTLSGLSLEDSCISFLSYFSNLGSGSGATGPDACLADLPTASKWILAFDMLIGRLEIVTVLLMFSLGFRRPGRI